MNNQHYFPEYKTDLPRPSSEPALTKEELDQHVASMKEMAKSLPPFDTILSSKKVRMQGITAAEAMIITPLKQRFSQMELLPCTS